MYTYHERKENQRDATNVLRMSMISICVLFATKVTRKPCCLLGLLLLTNPIVTITKEKKE